MKEAISFDPRTKLVMVVVGLLVTYLSRSLVTEILFVALFLLPFFWTGHKKRGLRLAVSYLILLLVARYVLPHVTYRALYYMLSFFSVGIRSLQPTFIPAIFAWATTPVAEWLALLKSWRMPKALITLVAVMGRFGPTLRQDYRKIRQAMAFRGISTSFWGLLKSPLRSFEYVLIPLLMNATQVAEDLTLSALTKGISLPGRHTSLVQLKLGAGDYLYMGALIAIFFVWWIGGNL